ncbi:cystatin-B-like [Arapaima gigas]
MLCGGTGGVQDATSVVQKLCDEVRAAAEEKAGTKFDTFTAEKFTTQVVAGTNYFVKVRVCEESFVHVRIFQALPHAGGKVEFVSLQASKSSHDPIGFF